MGKNDNTRQLCRQRAYRRLAQRYKDDFDLFFEFELDQEGHSDKPPTLTQLQMVEKHYEKYADLREMNIDTPTIIQVLGIDEAQAKILSKKWRLRS